MYVYIYISVNILGKILILVPAMYCKAHNKIEILAF